MTGREWVALLRQGGMDAFADRPEWKEEMQARLLHLVRVCYKDPNGRDDRPGHIYDRIFIVSNRGVGPGWDNTAGDQWQQDLRKSFGVQLHQIRIP
jgi:hypothetical protein